ncbi:MAG: hypothetical protein ABUS57_05835 [Pseudomonadota bacterium]
MISILVGTGVTAWAASTVHVLQAYAPLSWIFAGLIAFLILALGNMAFGVGAFWRTTAKIRASFYRERDRVNPLEQLFRNQRIAIHDLITPFERRVEEKTFIDCELIGPANIYISASGTGSISFVGNTFLPSETVLVRDGVHMPNVIVFHNCAFTRCKFYGVTLFFSESSFAIANRLISNLHWVTATPGPAPSADIVDEVT